MAGKDYTYNDLRKAEERARQAGINQGKNQGERDMLARLRTWLTQEERRVNH